MTEFKERNWDQDSYSSGGENAEVRKEKKEPSVASSVSEFNEHEIEYLDKFLPECENILDVKFSF